MASIVGIPSPDFARRAEIAALALIASDGFPITALAEPAALVVGRVTLRRTISLQTCLEIACEAGLAPAAMRKSLWVFRGELGSLVLRNKGAVVVEAKLRVGARAWVTLPLACSEIAWAASRIA